MSAGAGQENIHFTFEDVERGGTKVAFAENDLAFLEDTLDDCALVQFKESSGDAFKDWKFEQLFDVERQFLFFLEVLAHDLAVGECACGARNHTFPAGDARR